MGNDGRGLRPGGGKLKGHPTGDEHIIYRAVAAWLSYYRIIRF